MLELILSMLSWGTLGIFYREKVNAQEWILIVLSFVGVILTMDISKVLRTNHILVVGASCAIGAAAFYSLVTILMRTVSISYYQVIFIQLLAGIIILWPFVYFHALNLIAIDC
jgi:drug/metabolite transporter (DMT)-like permease